MNFIFDSTSVASGVINTKLFFVMIGSSKYSFLCEKKKKCVGESLARSCRSPTRDGRFKAFYAH